MHGLTPTTLANDISVDKADATCLSSNTCDRMFQQDLLYTNDILSLNHICQNNTPRPLVTTLSQIFISILKCSCLLQLRTIENKIIEPQSKVNLFIYPSANAPLIFFWYPRLCTRIPGWHIIEFKYTICKLITKSHTSLTAEWQGQTYNPGP